MMLSLVSVGLAAVCSLPLAFASALPNGFSVSQNKYDLPLGQMTFNGTLGGHKVILSGSIQDIHLQMSALYPDFNPNSTLSADISLALETRSEAYKVEAYCLPIPGQPTWHRALTFRIVDGINYLKAFQGLCGVPARTCVRISCSYNSGIYLCNDNEYGITPNCGYIASYAADLIALCQIEEEVGGQMFDTDRYNVIVHSDSC